MPESVAEQLQDFVERVRALRDHAEATRERVRELQEQWEAEHARELEAARVAQTELAVAEEALRQRAVTLWESLTPEEREAKRAKTLRPGVGIRERTVVEYDTGKAFEWAKHHHLCLQLDAKAFEKLVKDSPGVIGEKPWIDVRLEPYATLGKEM